MASVLSNSKDYSPKQCLELASKLQDKAKFSIAAINDTDSREQHEPLAPTKEAQEFHLTQTYHEGLLKLQAKEYEKARELLEAVVKNPLICTDQADGTAGDDHLLQLRFLALKNLATVFLEQGCDYYENALHCYLQAVEIDSKDSVVWNQLGTLACSMGMLSISRWAFEQGLVCSPNNWNCMEKLLEVLIAIGDEVACLSVAELILRHWPSHARALHIKRTIEDLESAPFAARGIDKLEPKHVRLKFVDKRKASNDNLDQSIASKRLNQTIELLLTEPSWTTLADEILQTILSIGGCDSEKGGAERNSLGDTRIAIYLPSDSEKGQNSGVPSGENITNGECNTRDESISDKKEGHYFDEIHERRSSRLESLRSHKLGKEDIDFSERKDVAKVVTHFLQPFIMSGQLNQDFDYSPRRASDNEWQDVKDFVEQTSKNFGAYHLGHLLLEEVTKRGLLYRDAFLNFLELEKLTRLWGCDRTPECSLFLAELYYDFSSLSSNSSMMSELMPEASYHLSKVIESVALDFPLNLDPCWGKSCLVISEISRDNTKKSADFSQRLKQSSSASILTEKSSFWVRFFWLSGLVSIWEGNRARAHEEFSVSLSLLENNRNLNDIPGSIKLPHCKVNKELTTDKLLHEINLLEVEYLLKNNIAEMLEKKMYLECIDLLAPLLLSTKGVHMDMSPIADKDEGVTTGELAALDVIIEACEKAKPLNIEVYLNCHRRKLQIFMIAAGMEDYVASCELFGKKTVQEIISASGAEPKENLGENCFNSIAEHVKAISKCASLVQNYIDHDKDSNDITVPRDIIGNIQTLLLTLMCNTARMCFCKKSSPVLNPEQKQRCFFVNVAIAFCKLQHLDLTVPMKTQVDLIVAIHDLLAEYGLCCVGEDGQGVDGTFLKIAIKHLLTLDMKVKSNYHSLSKCAGESLSSVSDDLVSESSEKIAPDTVSSLAIEHEKDYVVDVSTSKFSNKEEPREEQVTPVISEIAEDEIEELESSIDNALNQCFFCLYGLNLRSDSTYEDDLAVHRNTSQADYKSKEQCADVFKYILPYAKDSTKTRLLKLRRVLRAIRKHFLQPPDDVLVGNPIDKYLDDPNLCENKLSEEAGSNGFLESIIKVIFSDTTILKQKKLSVGSCEPYMEVYSNLYYLLAQSEETSATDKWPGFVLTKEGEDFVEQSANISKYDLLFNPLRFESWRRLANIYDEEVDLLLNDGSKNINVTGWRKNASLPQRVEASRRRSRRCLLMSLALAKTSEQQSEIHELLALVYYDGVQNVVPFYDQRYVAPSRDPTWLVFCKNSRKHFEKAFAHRQDWSHAFYLGKLCEKLGSSPELSFSYYSKAIDLNPSAVDAIHRMHASRLKLLYTSNRKNVEVLKVTAAHSFNHATKERVMSILERLQRPNLDEVDNLVDVDSENLEESNQLDNVWHLLYSDCLSALQICFEGDLKHFHKARYMLAQGLYKRGGTGDLEKAKDEISFCFKSSRSSFTINMWEIDSSTKKGRRRAAGIGGSKKALEVNLPESSRKFITCIRKYLLFYLKLLEETRDVCTLDRAYVFIRADKRFSLCLEDLVPVALGRYLKTLISSMLLVPDASALASRNSPEQILEKMFTLFMEQGSLWSDMCSLPEIKCPEFTESKLYGYLHQYLYSLEGDVKLEVLEGINEKIRKRCKNPKLANGSSAGVFKHASVAWCRSLIINLVLVTPQNSSTCVHADVDVDTHQLLCVDLQTKEFWNSSFGDATYLASLEMKWNSLLSQAKHVIIKKTSEENLDTANSLLRSAYSFYRDSSSIVLTSGINLFWVPVRLVTTGQYQPGTDGIEIVDMSVPRKLLMWAYTLLHGRSSNISAVVKYCEENVKVKSKKASAGLSSSPAATVLVGHIVAGGNKDVVTSSPSGCEAGVSSSNTRSSEACIDPGTNAGAANIESQKIQSIVQQLHHCNNNAVAEITFDLNDDADPEKF